MTSQADDTLHILALVGSLRRDEKAREVVAAQMAAFAAWVRRFGAH